MHTSPGTFFRGLLPFFCLIFGVFSASFANTVRINEVMASNGATIADEDGDYEDWIELYNYGSEPVDLTGWGLSDNPGSPFKWSFPAGTSIGPDDYLLVWASGKDRSGDVLHTNYAIAAAGEALVLSQAEGVVIDAMDPVVMPRDVSYGRAPDQGAAWFFFDEPTPGGANTTTAYAGVTERPAFSQPAGFYAAGFDLQITHPDADAVIYYSTDGSDPDPAAVGGAIL
ncbi:MAG: hypothetical protein EA353_01300 [Puniceicoccaceae bacterium]|nr:MAG: hypothetical protein EA353_01300 [Puniceicoccaceae bacterium]